MCIFVQSVRLHYWQVVLENRMRTLESPWRMVAIVCSAGGGGGGLPYTVGG